MVPCIIPVYVKGNTKERQVGSQNLSCWRRQQSFSQRLHDRRADISKDFQGLGGAIANQGGGGCNDRAAEMGRGGGVTYRLKIIPLYTNA
jgi:hypothetical protein